jgi:DNA replicative helicase MCM subunit Mcm2 (Cdc46/Mcm family)
MTEEQLKQEISEIESLEKQHNLTKHNLYNKHKLHPKYTTSLKSRLTKYYKNMEKLKEVLRNSEKED